MKKKQHKSLEERTEHPELLKWESTQRILSVRTKACPNSQKRHTQIRVYVNQGWLILKRKVLMVLVICKALQ